MNITLHSAASTVAIVLTFVAFVPYIRSILQGVTKPHVFSWLIWALTTFIVCGAQFEAKGGVGAWPTLVAGLATLSIAVLAYVKQADNAITRTDWLFLLLALSSLPFWYITHDPLWAVLILTGVDLLGFGPTFRKVYHHPEQESEGFFALFAFRNVFAVIALEVYSLTNVLFPAAVGLSCVVLCVLVVWRKRQLAVNKTIAREGDG